jgi:hypothetical protein
MPFAPATLLKTSAALLVLTGPLAVGALPPPLFWPPFAVAAAAAAAAFARGSVRARKFLLVALSAAVVVTACDLALRLSPLVPDDLVERWPRMPLVNRSAPNLNYEGYRFNDLSRMAGVREWREDKLVRVVTDSAGFRNDPGATARPLDVVILGDSFAAGAVSHEHTWASVLARDYGRSVYSLASPAAGPWHEYVNLWAERDRLKINRGAVLVWQLFTGNDLEDDYGPLEMGELPWRGAAAGWRGRVETARRRSPVRLLLRRRRGKQTVVASDFPNGRKLLFYKPYIEAASRTPEEVVGHPNYARLRATVAAVKSLSEALGLRPSVVLVPAKEEVYSWVWRGEAPWTGAAVPSGFAAVLKRVCEEEGLPFLDLKPSLFAESRRVYEESGRLLYWYDDTHLNTEGSRFTASVLYRELLQGRDATPAPDDSRRAGGGL